MPFADGTSRYLVEKQANMQPIKADEKKQSD
jgi:hypothetical protein